MTNIAYNAAKKRCRIMDSCFALKESLRKACWEAIIFLSRDRLLRKIVYISGHGMVFKKFSIKRRFTNGVEFDFFSSWIPV